MDIYLKENISVDDMIEYCMGGNYLKINSLPKNIVKTLTTIGFVKIANSSKQILDIPKHLRNHITYDALLEAPCSTISRIPHDYLDLYNTNKLSNERPDLIHLLPQHLVTFERVLNGIKKGKYKLIDYLLYSEWYKFSRDEFIDICAKKPQVMEDICGSSYSNFDQSFFDEVYSRNNKSCKYIPGIYQTIDMKYKMLDINPLNLKYVYSQTYELIEYACKKNPLAHSLADYQSALENKNLEIINDL